MKIWKILMACLLVMVLLTAATAVFAAEPNESDAEKLQALLDIANSVKEEKYTTDTWEILEEAVAFANEAMSSGDEQQIKNAISKLASALAKLTSVKYDAMEEAIAQAEQYMKENDHGFTRLKNAVAQAEATYGCGSQLKVDRATEEILNCLEDYRNGNIEEKTDDDKKPFPIGIVIACVFVCVASCIAVVVVVVLFRRNKSNRTRQIDDVPLVDYDIDDDLI